MTESEREDYETQNLELRNTFKERKDVLAHEKLEREKVYQSFLHEKFQLGRGCEQIKNLKKGIYHQAYLELQNNRWYCEERFLREEAAVAQVDGIIQKLQTLYD